MKNKWLVRLKNIGIILRLIGEIIMTIVFMVVFFIIFGTVCTSALAFIIVVVIFIKFVNFIDAKLSAKSNLSKVCGCGCGKPLEPRIDGERHKIDDKEVNDNCYFANLDKEVEKYRRLAIKCL